MRDGARRQRLGGSTGRDSSGDEHRVPVGQPDMRPAPGFRSSGFGGLGLTLSTAADKLPANLAFHQDRVGVKQTRSHAQSFGCATSNAEPQPDAPSLKVCRYRTRRLWVRISDCLRGTVTILRAPRVASRRSSSRSSHRVTRTANTTAASVSRRELPWPTTRLGRASGRPGCVSR
jgi:hypothetical protein